MSKNLVNSNEPPQNFKTQASKADKTHPNQDQAPEDSISTASVVSSNSSVPFSNNCAKSFVTQIPQNFDTMLNYFKKHFSIKDLLYKIPLIALWGIAIMFYISEIETSTNYDSLENLVNDPEKRQLALKELEMFEDKEWELNYLSNIRQNLRNLADKKSKVASSLNHPDLNSSHSQWVKKLEDSQSQHKHTDANSEQILSHLNHVVNHVDNIQSNNKIFSELNNFIRKTESEQQNLASKSLENKFLQHESNNVGVNRQKMNSVNFSQNHASADALKISEYHPQEPQEEENLDADAVESENSAEIFESKTEDGQAINTLDQAAKLLAEVFSENELEKFLPVLIIFFYNS